MPLFPFHTWLPDAHTEAPTAGSVLLAGVLLKLGTYGFIRFNLTLFPDAAVRLAPWLAALAVIGIIYGALVAIVQPDVKRLVAYSSVSHLGLHRARHLRPHQPRAPGWRHPDGQPRSHTGALFLLIGMIYERRHTRHDRRLRRAGQGHADLSPGRSCSWRLPRSGCPGCNGFIGEFEVLLGSYLSLPVSPIIAAFGVVLAAVYLLWAYERMFTGPLTKPENEKLRRSQWREILILVPLVALIVFLGVYPKPALDRIEPSVDVILERIEATTDYEVPEFGTSKRSTRWPSPEGSTRWVTLRSSPSPPR